MHSGKWQPESRAATQTYLGARTAFGVITHITDSVYSAVATVRAKDGSTSTQRLTLLIALGLTRDDPT